MKILGKVEFGSAILRGKAKKLSSVQIVSDEVQQLIRDMRHTLRQKRDGVALAAPQVGEPLALVVIRIRPTKHRPKVVPFDLVLINPKISKLLGRKKDMWEGCLSAGKGGLFAKVPRYSKVEISFVDEKGQQQTAQFAGLKAQVIQHETDHLNGVLFVDHVKDTKTYMTLMEYRKHQKLKML